mmetsp:Transcript_36110/g.93925  ORF Transcript_36110/g.93925 Transcript_36110/m.93925 type:complete len:527 (-) Transcript_36110:2849-4429(-)
MEFICRVFDSCLDPSHSGFFLEGLVSELASERHMSSGAELINTLSSGTDAEISLLGDKILFNRLIAGVGIPSQFLVACHERCMKTPTEKENVKMECKRLCFSYLTTALTVPDLFPTQSNQPASLAYFATSQCSERASQYFQNTFLPEYVKYLLESQTPLDEIKAIVTPYFTEIRFVPSSDHFLDKSSSTSSLARIILKKGVFNALSLSELFIVDGILSASEVTELEKTDRMFQAQRMASILAGRGPVEIRATGSYVEKKTPIGILFSFSCLPAEPGFLQSAFPSLDDKIAVHNTVKELRHLRSSHIDSIMALLTQGDGTQGILKDPSTRRSFLDWIAYVLSLNSARGKLSYAVQGSHEDCSDGFALNLCDLLLRLCEPFFTLDAGKISKIDATYFFSKHRLHVRDDEARLAASCDQALRWVDARNLDMQRHFQQQQKAIEERERRYQNASDGEDQDKLGAFPVSEKFGSISEFFFMCLKSIQLGPVALFFFSGAVTKIYPTDSIAATRNWCFQPSTETCNGAKTAC